MDRLAGRIVRRLREEPDAPEFVGLDDDTADQIFDALAAETSRGALSACYERPRTASDLADELDTSLQNAAYHLDKLEAAALLEPVETRYGSNGRELTAYGPTREAIVLVAGDRSFLDRLETTARRLFGPVTLLGLASVVAGVLFGTDWSSGAGLGMGDAAPGESVSRGTESIVGIDWTATVVVFLLGSLAVLVASRRVRRRPTGAARRRSGHERVPVRAWTTTETLYMVAAGTALATTLFVVTDPGSAAIEWLGGSSPGGPVLVSLAAGSLTASVGAILGEDNRTCLVLGSAPAVGVMAGMGISFGDLALLAVLVLAGGPALGLLATVLGYLLGYGVWGRVLRA